MTDGIRGLLLINAAGEVYVIRGGIKPYKQTKKDVEELGLEKIDPTIAAALIRKCEDEARTKWFKTEDGQPDDESNINLGPRAFQAFNVLLPDPEGEAGARRTGNSSAFSMS